MQNSLEIAVKKGFKEIYNIDIESVEFLSISYSGYSVRPVTS